MSVSVKLSSKGQVVIPSHIRQQIALNPGEELFVDLEDGRIVMWPRPKSYSQQMRGLHKKVWQDVDAVEYVQKERSTWEKGRS